MVSVPETQFAQTADGDFIAYQVFGDGPHDLVFMHDWATHVEMLWEDPHLASFARRLAAFARVVVFDKRGVGLSDPLPAPGAPTLEVWMDDLSAVLDAVGLDRAVFYGAEMASALFLLHAAMHPDRVAGLVLVNATARVRRDTDYPAGIPDHLVEGFLSTAIQGWGRTARHTDFMGAAIAGDPVLQSWLARFQRNSVSPGAFASFIRMLVDSDVRSVLSSIRAPTLVLHRRDDPIIRIEHGRYLADHIEGAHFVELAGDDHLADLGDAGLLLQEIRQFLTGDAVTSVPDRVLTSVLFTDIVDSTAHVARIGDDEWGFVLDRHHAIVRRQLDRFRGREVKTTGDGFLATFDGPARAIHCACAIRDAVRPLGIAIRAGIHTGEIELAGEDIAGIAVHVGARVAGLAEADEVLVSSTVPALVAGSGIAFVDRGIQTLKGVPGEWRLYAVEA